jgi:hypothetical protein
VSRSDLATSIGSGAVNEMCPYCPPAARDRMAWLTFERRRAVNRETHHMRRR